MALDKIYCMCEQAKQTRFLSGCKLQRLRRNRVWKQNGSVAESTGLRGPTQAAGEQAESPPSCPARCSTPAPASAFASNAETRGG